MTRSPFVRTGSVVLSGLNPRIGRRAVNGFWERIARMERRLSIRAIRSQNPLTARLPIRGFSPESTTEPVRTKGERVMSLEENTALVRRYMEATVVDPNAEKEFLAPEYINH